MANYSRRNFIKSTGASLLGVPFLGSLFKSTGENPPEDAPNIVFLFSDDHSVPDLGCYGNTAIQTPNLDRLASEGMRFNRAYVSSPQCSPSRASILTGRPPHQVEASRLHADVPARETNVIRLLNDQGYYTGGYRKIHQPKMQRDFHFYGGESEPLDSFFKEIPDDRPFFLWFGSHDPHRGYSAGAFDPPHKPEEVQVPGFLPDTPEVRQDLAYYYDEIARFDQECGKIMDLLEKHELTENTLIVMAGDNGMPFPRAKATLYEPGIRVPLLIKYPKLVEAGRVSDALVSLTDLTATWLNVVGIETPEYMSSISLLPLLRDETDKIRDFVYSGRSWHDNWDPMRCVITDRYKLIQNYRPEVPYYPSLDLVNSPTYKKIRELAKADRLEGKLNWYQQDSRPQVEFYDLGEDPGEWNNLAGQMKHEERVRHLQHELGDWMNRTGDFLPPPRDAFPNKQLNENIDPLDGKPYET